MTPIRKLTVLALLGSLVPTVALIVLTFMQTNGVWEYALDDVYIHLAMSEQIAKGGYGVNDGEFASASSSILYSYLLVPFAGSGFHVYWPLMLGLIGAAIGAVLWAQVIGRAWGQASSDVMDKMLLILATVGPVVLHFNAMSLIGMEHMLHIVVTLLALIGLIDFAKTGRVGWMLVLGLVMNPVLRFEGMAIAFLGCCVVFFGGKRAAALAILVLTLAPLVAHFWLMGQLGLDMLPNSVNAKAAIAGGGQTPDGAAKTDRLAKMSFTLLTAVASPSGRALIIGIFVGIISLLLARKQITGRLRLLGWMMVLAAMVHVLLGMTVEFYRYEVYVWTFMAGAGVYLLATLRFSSASLGKMLPVLFTIGVVYGGVHYPISAFRDVPGGGAAIHAQQRQMGLFVDTHWKAPVAVNDLGHVAYDNPYYVLDLWGLASSDALEARLRGDDPLWADKLAQKYDVGAAMVYWNWLHDHIPAHWVAVATLDLTIPRATLGGDQVTFYATRPEAVARLRTALQGFAPELPDSAKLEFKEISNE